MAWQPADDPMVLDLDGDGIETVSVEQSGVYFDLDELTHAANDNSVYRRVA